MATDAQFLVSANYSATPIDASSFEQGEQVTIDSVEVVESATSNRVTYLINLREKDGPWKPSPSAINTLARKLSDDVRHWAGGTFTVDIADFEGKDGRQVTFVKVVNPMPAPGAPKLDPSPANRARLASQLDNSIPF